MFLKTHGNFLINHRRAFGVYKTKKPKEGKAMRKGLCALLALVLALLPGMARSEAVFTREVDHVISMEALEGALLLSGSYADGEADRPSVKFLDFAGRRLYSRGDRAHDGGYADAALFGGGDCAVLRYGDEGYCVDFLCGRETVWSREVGERGAFNLFCDGERILVDGAPAVGVSTLTALDMDGATLWETRWEESLRFAGILACAEAIWPTAAASKRRKTTPSPSAWTRRARKCGAARGKSGARSRLPAWTVKACCCSWTISAGTAGPRA